MMSDVKSSLCYYVRILYWVTVSLILPTHLICPFTAEWGPWQTANSVSGIQRLSDPIRFSDMQCRCIQIDPRSYSNDCLSHSNIQCIVTVIWIKYICSSTFLNPRLKSHLEDLECTLLLNPQRTDETSTDCFSHIWVWYQSMEESTNQN